MHDLRSLKLVLERRRFACKALNVDLKIVRARCLRFQSDVELSLGQCT